jgi:hypothetical protein
MSWGFRMFPWRDRRGPLAPKRTPDAERAQIHIKRLVFSDGTQVEPQRNSIVVLTGPNNVGKSTFYERFLIIYRRIESLEPSFPT